MTTEVDSNGIRTKLKEAREKWPHIHIDLNYSPSELLEEMRRIDDKERGISYVWGIEDGENVEKAMHWRIYRQALTDGLEKDDKCDISISESDDLDIMIGRGQYDRVERILEEEYAQEVEA